MNQLQIYIFGPTDEGFLDVDPDTVLQMQSLMEAFDDDLSVGEFSLPVDLPWTDNNRRLMGFAERLENFSRKTKTWRIIVYAGGFPELPNAKLTMLEKSGTFAYTRGKFSASVSGNKGLFGSLVKNKKLTNLSLGAPINFTENSSKAFAEACMKEGHPEYDYLAFAPVAIETFFDTNRPDYDYEFLVLDRVNNIVNTGGSADAWTFDNPSGSGDKPRTVPFFKLKYVLKKIFEENGYSISGAFIDDPAFDDLVISNQFAIENYGGTTDYNRQILPANHQPDMLIQDFLVAVFSLFKMYPDFSAGLNEITLVYKKSILTNRRVLSLNNICDKTFSSQYDDSEQVDGYKIMYVWDSNDSYPSDRVIDDITKDKTMVASVAKFSDLGALDIGRTLTTDDIAYVEADNLYYQVADSTSTPKKWDAFAERMDPYVSGGGESEIDITCSPLLTYVEYNSDTSLYVKQDCVGCRQPGSYVNNKGVRVINPFGLRIFYIKKLSRNGAMVPVSFSHNRDADNNPIEKYTLAWLGDDGLGLNFHKDWEDMQLNREIVKTNIKTDQKVLEDLSRNNCVEINNVLFLPYQIQRTIPIKDSMEIDVVPL